MKNFDLCIQRIHLYQSKLNQANHDFFLPRIRYTIGKTDVYRRTARTAVICGASLPNKISFLGGQALQQSINVDRRSELASSVEVVNAQIFVEVSINRSEVPSVDRSSSPFKGGRGGIDFIGNSPWLSLVVVKCLLSLRGKTWHNHSLPAGGPVTV